MLQTHLCHGMAILPVNTHARTRKQASAETFDQRLTAELVLLLIDFGNETRSI